MTTRVDFSRSAVSRYIQLSTLFLARIESGEWPVGEQIPTVEQLATEFSVARATVRQALDVLGAEGVIERFRAKGTFVTRLTRKALSIDVPTDWSGLVIEPAGAEMIVRDLRKDIVPARVRHEIGHLAPAYWCWTRTHVRDGEPYYAGDAYVEAGLAARIPAGAMETMTTLRALKEIEGVHIAQVKQTLTVGMADVLVAGVLDIPLNAPVAHVYRTAIDDSGTIVFLGEGVYRGDMIRMEFTVT